MTFPSEFSATAQRRRYAKAFKADIVAQCQIAGASVARIARHHNLNANMVHRWIKEQPDQQVPVISAGRPTTSSFVALPRPVTEPSLSSPGIEIRIPHSSDVITVHCSADQVSSCATLLREWLT